MEWGTLSAAALGAVFGIASTLTTDLIRSRRDTQQGADNLKRAVYVRFLRALAQAHSRMTVAAFQPHPGVSREHAVHTAFLHDPQYSDAKAVLGELRLVAPEVVYATANEANQHLRAARDALAQGRFAGDSPEYRATMVPYYAALERLQTLMQTDVPVPSPRRPVRDPQHDNGR